MNTFIRSFMLAALLCLPWAATLKAQCDPGVAQCSITIQMTDSYGDGWNGNSIAVYQDTILRGTVTLNSGTAGEATVNICAGDSVTLIWNTGSYADETEFTVINGDYTTVVANVSGYIYSNGATIVTFMPVCPSCIKPSGLTFSNIDYESATISWTAGGDESEWLVTIGNDTYEAYSTNYYAYGLNAATTYNVSVRAYCDIDDTSAALTGSFRTACPGATCDVAIDINSDYGYYMPGVTVWQDGTALDTWMSSGTHTVSVCDEDTVTFTYLAPAWSWGTNTITIYDGGNTQVFSSNTGFGNGDTIFVLGDACPSCIPPANLHAEYRSADSIVVAWSPRSQEIEWLLWLNDSAIGSMADTFFVFEYLTANTEYTVKLQSVCGDDDSSSLVVKTFKTTCDVMTLPVTYDWEDIAVDGSWPSCWDRILAYGTDPSVNSQHNHTPNGNYAMFLLADGSYNMFASGIVPLPGDMIKVSFWVRMPSYGSNELRAGVMTNPDDTSTFIPMVTINGNNTDWTEYEFNTSNLDGYAQYYVAFRYYGEYYYYTGAIDDITITEYSPCDRPSAAWVDDVEEYSATLSWNSVDIATGYWVYYSTTNSIDDATELFCTDTTITLNSLMPQTTYTAWIASACGGSISTDYRLAGSFTTHTTCAPVTDVTLENVGYTAAQLTWNYDESVGFAHNGVQITLIDNSDANATPLVSYETGNMATFTGLAAGHLYTATLRTMCQTPLQMDTAETVTFQFSTNTCSEIAGDNQASSNYIPTYTFYGNSYSQTIYLASEIGGIDTIHGIAYNITSPNSGGNEARTVDVYMANCSNASFSGSNYATVSNAMLVASNKVLHSSQGGWQSIAFDSTFVYDGSSNLLVVVNDKTGAYGSTASFAGFSATGRGISSYRDGTTNQFNPLTETSGTSRNSIPNIRFVADCQSPTCEAPMLTLGNVDSNSITANWVALGEATTFVVALDGAIQSSTTANSMGLTNLTPNTAYTVAVGAICTTSGDTLWSSRTVKTTCEAMVLPYVETFENDNEGEMVSCWNVVHSYTYNSYYNGIFTYPEVTENGMNSDQALTLHANGTCMAATAALPNNGYQGDQYHISFYAKLSSNFSSAAAGVMTDPSHDTTFIQLATIANDDAWHRYDLYTSSLNATDIYHFAVRYDGTAGSNTYALHIDDLTIEYDAGCHYPANLSVTASTNSATLSWSNDGATTNYVVAYATSGSSSYSYVSAGSSTTMQLNNLQSASSYLFRVGNICNNGDTLWAEVSAVTGCGVVSLPYFEDFSAYAQDVLPPCWVYNSTAITHFDGGLFFRSNTGPGYPAVMPQFDGQISKLEIEFKTKVGPVSQGDAILVGVADASGTFIQWLDTLTDPNQSRSSFVWMTYRFDTYTGTNTGERIALGRLYSGSDWALIDDINVRQIPGCLPPENITGLNLYDPDSSYFTWTQSDNSPNFQVYVDTVTADTTTIPTSALIPVSGNSYLIPSGLLSGGGKYKFFIRTYCNPTTSPWSVVTFGSGEFIMSQSGTDTLTSCGLVIYDNGGPIAGYYASTNSSVVVYPAGNSNRLQVYGGYLSLYNDGNSTLTIYDGVGNGGNILYQTSYSGPTTMYDSIVTLPIATSTTGPLTINFSAGAYVNPGYELYIRCIPFASCDDPSYIQTTNISSNQASLSWYGNAANYNIYYRPYGSSSWSMTTSTTESVTLSGLALATTYEVQIRAICSSTDSSNLSNIFSFSTECEVVTITAATPLVEDFEGSQVPATCWQLVYSSQANASDNPVVYTAEAAYSGNAGLRFSSANQTANGNYNQTLITPELSSSSDLSILFYVRASQGTEHFRVGYSSTGSQTADFTWLPPTTIGTTWLRYRADIPSTTKYVAVNYYSYDPRHHLYVDSLVVAVDDGTQGCAQPVITDLSATASSITVNYLNLGPVQAAIVEGDSWNDNTPAEDLADGSSYTFDHLFSDNSPLADTTTYTIGLRSVCGDDYSDWNTMTISTRLMVCNTPTINAVVVINGTSASLSWMANGASVWEVVHSDGTNQWSQTVTMASAVMTDLTEGITYTVRVRAICGQHFSDWSETYSFVPSDCVLPTNLSTTNITSNSATLKWNIGNANQWEVAYGSANNFSIATATHVTVDNTEYTLTGLSGNHGYSWAVKAICSDEDVSGWSSTVNFTTLHTQGIGDVETASLAIHPNPASDQTVVSLKGFNGEVTITIVDLNGRTMATERLACDNDCSKTLQVDRLAKGVYFVRISDNEGAITVKKLIVK